MKPAPPPPASPPATATPLLCHEHLEQNVRINSPHSTSMTAVTVTVTATTSVRIVQVLGVDSRVVPLFFLRVHETLVRLSHFFELFFGLQLFLFRARGVAIWVVF